MANAGDSYIITLREPHVSWGEFRTTYTRQPRCGEGYIPIPKEYAIAFGIYNSNGTDHQDILGQNIFRCTSTDGTFQGILRAQGSTNAGAPYAKQFAGDGDLRSLGYWFQSVQAVPGDSIRVTWTSPYDIVIEKL